jgi:SPX domain protein involved in polyphosphate accumulation
MKYGNQLLLQRNPLWKNYYFTYEQAKTMIKALVKEPTEEAKKLFFEFIMQELKKGKQEKLNS